MGLGSSGSSCSVSCCSWDCSSTCGSCCGSSFIAFTGSRANLVSCIGSRRSSDICRRRSRVCLLARQKARIVTCQVIDGIVSKFAQRPWPWLRFGPLLDSCSENKVPRAGSWSIPCSKKLFSRKDECDGISRKLELTLCLSRFHIPQLT